MSEVAVAENVSRIYMPGENEVRALDGMSLTVRSGEMVAVAGPSGSGKTTLLNMFGCLDRPDSGKILLDGVDVTRLGRNQLAAIRASKVGFIFQSFHLIPVLSAYENVEFALQVQGKVPPSQRKELIMPLLKSLGIDHLADRRPSNMSGGQQQRVAIARALVKKPALVLADEPTANLDSKTSLAIIEEMVRLNKEEGATFIFSTHDPMVMDASPRVVSMIDGKVESDVIKE